MPGLIDGWTNWKKRNPVKGAVLDVLPVTGQVTAGLDYASAMRDGDGLRSASAATGLIPGLKLAKYGTQLAPAGLRLLSRMNPVERAIAPVTKVAPAIGHFNNAGDIGQAGAQTYNNSQVDPVTGQLVRKKLPIMASAGERV